MRKQTIQYTSSLDALVAMNCWSKIKNILRRIGARTYPDLLKALDAALAEVTIENLLGWFTHCCYCTSQD